MNERLAYDVARAGPTAVAGADEAGRGCLAGPLVAAAVCFDYGVFGKQDHHALDALDDSKRLDRVQRESLYDEIVRRARQVVMVVCAPETIDREGLHRCNLASLSAAVEGLRPPPEVVLVDGFVLPGCACPHEALVGGDGLSAAVAAASIMAKVTRDRLMRRLHDAYPEYGFGTHVGYATREHHEAIGRYGLCRLHRRSFASVAYRQLDLELGTIRRSST